MPTTVSLSFAALTVDSADPAALADFWGKALGRPVSPGAVAGDTAVDVAGPEAGPRMILHHPPGPGARPGRQAAQRHQAPGGPLGLGFVSGPPDHVRRPGGQRVRPGDMATADRVAAKPRALTEAATTILDRRPPTAATPIQDHQNWPLLPLPGLRVQADAAPRSQYGCGADRPHGCRPGSGGEDHPLETLSGPEAVVADLAGCAGSGHETGQHCRKDE